ncbi:acyltransferase family protein [Sinimarinibacterium flocculans]|uniref:acyltransferase family protein n=1 Tax=Sinimarinibacterium flocculans TaxID=985250 RepID=UPI0035123909
MRQASSAEVDVVGSSRFNSNIHGLRGLAALMVFGCHVYAGAYEAGFYPDTWPTLFAWMLNAGRYGVDVFFLISGYLITETLARKHHIKRFLLDRAIRLYPAFIGVLLPLIVMGIATQARIFGETEPASWPFHILSSLLFLPGVFPLPAILGVAWSLSFEAAFYLTAASAFALGRAHRRVLAGGIVLIVSIVLLPQYPGIVCFHAGVLVYLYRFQLRRALRLLRSPVLMLLAFLVLRDVIARSAVPGELLLSPLMSVLLALLFISALAFFSALVEGAGALSALMRCAPMQFMGTISYSFYLWHTPVMYLTKRWVHASIVPAYGEAAGTLAFAAISLPPAILISYLSYRVLEAGAGRVLHRRLSTNAGRQPAADAVS